MTPPKTLYEVATVAAKDLVRAHKLPWHMVEDLTQDGVLYLLEHPRIVANATDKDGTLYGGTLVNRLRREIGKRAAREAREANRGREPEEEPTYTARTLAVAVPVVWDPDYLPERPESIGRVSSGKDPAESGTWLAVCADVKRAADWYGRERMGLLFRHYVLNETWDDIAYDLGDHKSSVHRRGMAILEAMADWLNTGGEE